MRPGRVVILAALLAALPAWQARSQAVPLVRPAYEGAAYAPRPGRPQPSVAALTALGRAMFFDASLSGTGRVSCASCHDPAHAYGPPNGLSVQPPGDPTAQPAFRAAPSLRYLQTLPAFSQHQFDNDGNDSVDMGPTGGHDWDGRAGSTHEQARLPMLSSSEMGNAGPAAVVARLRRAPYAAQFTLAFGAEVSADEALAFDSAMLALEVFEQSPADFYPYTSRYDEVLRGRATLSPDEAHGLALFEDPDKGNCAACHLSQRTADGAHPLFTDFGHIAIGVPRNRSLPVNADPAFFDMGLCGPLRTDLRDEADDCGRFRTPSLRNVALREVFFHNGSVHSLAEAVRFYVERDTDPARWYGDHPRFDDLPPGYRANVNSEPPFGGRPRERPALTEAEIADVVAFLKTLTDADQLPPAPR